MCKIKIFKLLCVGILILLTPALMAETFAYRKTIKQSVNEYSVTVSKTDNGFVYENMQEGETYWCNNNLSTRSVEIVKPGQNSRLTFSRDNNTIRISGIRKGNSIEKDLAIDESPWYQNFTYSLTNFINSDKKKIQFWVINPEELKSVKFSAKKKGIEKIEVNGNIVKAYYVKISIAGILSLFWSADYWYDTVNGKFIKFKGTQGPGTQESVVELIQ